MKKKLYAGIAATAIAATGLVCSAGAAHAEGTWPSSLGFVPDGAASTAISADATKLYTVAVDNDDQTKIDVAVTTFATGTSTHHQLTLTPGDGDSIYQVDAVAVSSTGTVLVAANQESGDSGIWTASVAADTATESLSGVEVGMALAVSPDGSRGVVASGSGPITFSIADDAASDASDPITLDSTEGAFAWPDDVVINNDGGLQVAGDDYPTGDDPSTPTLWAVNAEGQVTSTQQLDNEPLSLATAGSTVLVGETDYDSTFTLQAFDDSGSTSVALPDEPDLLAVSPDNGTVWASDGYGVERLDLGALGSYGDDNPVPEGSLTSESVFGLVATSDALYSIGSQSDNDGNWTDATLSRLTKPGKVTDATQSVYSDGSIQLEWTAPTDDGGADLTYVVTLKDKTTSKVITDETSNTYDYLTSVNGLQAGHTYDITVRAENAGFAGDEVTVAPVLSGSAKVTVSGSAVVGGTLTAAVSENKFPAGTTLSYQWGYSGGNYGGAIEGATATKYSPTKDMIGMHVMVIVTATHDGFSPAQVTSNAVVVQPAAGAPSAPQPATVTKIKPATIKANAKKVKLTLPGITVAKAPGKVKVYDGKKLIGTAKIVNGKLVVKLKKHLSHGKHKLKLKYKGSAQVAKFNKKVKLKVK
jgi:hypothetical protein